MAAGCSLAALQRMYDDLVIALVIVVSLGCVSACFYMVYHSAMIAICYYRDTPPDQRAHTRPTYRIFRIRRSCITEKELWAYWRFSFFSCSLCFSRNLLYDFRIRTVPIPRYWPEPATLANGRNQIRPLGR